MHLPFVDNCEQLRFVNTSAPTPQDRYRVQAKLARDEQIVWLGRPVPSFRYQGWRFNLLVLERRPAKLSKYKEVPIGFENISPADADAAEQAIRRLKRTPPSTP